MGVRRAIWSTTEGWVMALVGARTAALLGSVAAVLIALSPSQALATHVQCGDVITQDTTLDSDLVNCPGDGVVIGAGGITLDLSGHTIDGTGVGDGGTGVDDEGHDGVTVGGGRIQEFFSAVYLDDADANVVRDLSVTDTGQAIYLEHADGNVIERNVVTSSGNGVYIYLTGNDNVISANSFSGGGGGITLVGSTDAVDGTRLLARTRVEGNRLVGNDVGFLSFFAAATQVQGNRVSGNTEGGILESGFQAAIVSNTVAGNGFGMSIAGYDNRVSRNRVTGNGTDGIKVQGGTNTGRIVLEGNVASGNGDDGIDVDVVRTTITRNTANDNGDYGIEAVPDVIDGGGNKARGNGNPAQCLNVFCK
jgi:parallel beta-helix repeat protein